MSNKLLRAMIPALHTAMSISPNSSLTRFSMVATGSGCVPSPVMGIPAPPPATISAANSCSGSGCRAAIATAAPACAYASATCLPIPLEAPVTRAFLPCRANRLITFTLDHDPSRRPTANDIAKVGLISQLRRNTPGLIAGGERLSRRGCGDVDLRSQGLMNRATIGDVQQPLSLSVVEVAG